MTYQDNDREFAPDCGAVTPEEECGECEACDKAAYQGIENDVEAGRITEAEAREAHALRGH
ncbi:hypothetical protein [Streptomyces odonnellii]|uniref:hypothetical protein n=1 Tax=Streptomyces odonnellii TaxID=1417980 RepID=UPI000626A5C5|nr:hypothetical protein [Streptomyces odonnellii]